jgi:hypothetical protein
MQAVSVNQGVADLSMPQVLDRVVELQQTRQVWGSPQQSIAAFFDARFDAITKTLNYNPSWEREAYLDEAMFDKVLAAKMGVGKFAKTTDANGRKIIIVGTRYGVVLVFQRYGGDSEHLVYHMPWKIQTLRQVEPGFLSMSGLHKLLGDEIEPNVGVWSEAMASWTAT